MCFFGQSLKISANMWNPFGEMWVEEASTVDISHITRFFTNQQYDKESGLYYYNARYYDPHLGSFLTPDPGMSGLNHYAYCNANPINYTDPTGLEDEKGDPNCWEDYQKGYDAIDKWLGDDEIDTGGGGGDDLDGDGKVGDLGDKIKQWKIDHGVYDAIKAWNDLINSQPYKQEEYKKDFERHKRYEETWGRFPWEWVSQGEIPYIIDDLIKKNSTDKWVADNGKAYRDAWAAAVREDAVKWAKSWAGKELYGMEYGDLY